MSKNLYKNNNIIPTIFFVVIFVIASFYFFMDKNRGENCVEVLTDARNPETGEIKEFSNLCDIPKGWDVLETDREQFERNNQSWTRYRNDDLGVRFEYRLDPDGYILIDSRSEWVNENKDVVESLHLFNKKEYKELLASDIPREYPPSISVLIFKNSKNYSVKEWIEKEKMISNIEFAVSEIEEIDFSGSPAVKYKISGLYENEILVVLNNGLIYYIDGAYLQEDSQIRKDFVEMLNYFSLY
ncbi:hypothetical protein A2811_01430 [Candidatus Campbellbacteria bacterium RIFCSPHIGHO2_01_FULL_34_10]|uniref:Uncharacterized protein n=2 Tax=Candidatus Campbelliibacteriota TaxID=1752727 RepID=A0A1F5ELD2_9BACT|nr:MAG: hypothetical protein A2811_01430 [Candidatus Campbellbacteria bacterium RIFCSPHIGHO2_01_FULL_34_10]